MARSRLKKVERRGKTFEAFAQKEETLAKRVRGLVKRDEGGVKMVARRGKKGE